MKPGVRRLRRWICGFVRSSFVATKPLVCTFVGPRKNSEKKYFSKYLDIKIFSSTINLRSKVLSVPVVATHRSDPN